MTCSGNDRVAEEVESALLVLLPTSMFDDEGDSSLVRWGGLRRNPIPGGTFHWEDYAANKTGNWIRSLRPRSQSFENDFRRQFRTISSNSQSHGKTSLFRNVWLEGNRTASTKFQSSNWGTREARMKSREWVIICAPTLCVTCARLVLISICLKNATNYACSEVWNS